LSDLEQHRTGKFRGSALVNKLTAILSVDAADYSLRISMKRSFSLFAAATASLLLTGLALASPTKELKRAQTATTVLQTVLNTPDARIPDQLLKEAYAIAVFPEVVKAGLVFGGRHGRGLVSVRAADGTWSNPSFIRITGGSVGWQAGVQAADIVLVFRSEKGVQNLVNGKFTLGADASVAAGPVGRQAQAGTDEELSAEIFTYSRARGLFAGVAIDGSALSIDHGANRDVYGPNITPRMLFENRLNAPAPAEIVAFRDQLEEQTSN
jgi:lipid-binding SYLF domain-containing protein